MNDQTSSFSADGVRVDLRLIAEMIDPGSRVLDVGCGEGLLLSHLVATKNVDGRGMELSQSGVNACVASGLSVIQGDADVDLADYPDRAFDYAVSTQTLQATRYPKQVLQQLLRIADKVVISFPNFAHWRVRWYLLSQGRMPVTKALPISWYETPNIHFFTIRDFVALCEEMEILVVRAVAVSHHGAAQSVRRHTWRANVFGAHAIFLLQKL